jgi:hypothetical protein
MKFIPTSLLRLRFLIALSPISLFAQQPGCTDILALNYNAKATINNGTCTYAPASVVVSSSIKLPAELEEGSGLVYWNKLLWTHNDNSDTRLYGIRPDDGTLIRKISLPGLQNKDWEDVAQDSLYLYIGDFGNNTNGSRRDLHIYRIPKAGTDTTAAKVDSIFFNYADQTDFSNTTPNQTDYDCEAFIVSGDSIYLFTKQWVSGNCAIYSIPARRGQHVARKVANLQTLGMITGATYLPGDRIIALIGYSKLLQPFIYLLYDFQAPDFTGANKRKITLNQNFQQAEGIAAVNGTTYHVSTEHFVREPLVNNAQTLHKVDLRDLLQPFLNKPLSTVINVNGIPLRVLPSPGSGIMYALVQKQMIGSNFRIIDLRGRTVLRGIIAQEKFSLPTSGWAEGSYVMIAETEGGHPVYYRFVR